MNAFLALCAGAIGGFALANLAWARAGGSPEGVEVRRARGKSVVYEISDEDPREERVEAMRELEREIDREGEP